MPIDYSKYHPAWRDRIRPDILKRDNYKCLVCRLPQRSQGYRMESGQFVHCDEFELSYRARRGQKNITIFLAVAHLDHIIQNNDYTNLASMCQKCHNNHDQPNRIINRKIKTK